jgi:hypothetical protein
MALIPCTCIYGPAPSHDDAAGTVIALARDPWCPAAAVHDRVTVQPTATDLGDLEAMD